MRVHVAGCSVADGIERNAITYGRTWHLDTPEDQSDLAWIIIHVLKPKMIHLGTPCTKQCQIGPRTIDTATKAMNDLTKAICQYQSAIGLYFSVETPKGALIFTQPDWVEFFGPVPSRSGHWKHHELDGCQLGSTYPGDDDRGAPHRKSQIWLANFGLSGMELRCRRPSALAGSSHDHKRIRGRMLVSGKSFAVAEHSGKYSAEPGSV